VSSSLSMRVRVLFLTPISVWVVLVKEYSWKGLNH
jgi:hypothetical protein